MTPSPEQPALPPKSPKVKPKRKRKGKMGRTDLRTRKDVVKRVIDAILAGNTFNNAAALAGISDRTFYVWMADTDPKPYKLRFIQQVKEAEAKCIHRNVMVIQQASIKNWQAAAWYLERRRHKDWGRIDRVEGTDGDPIKTIGLVAEVEMPKLDKSKLLDLVNKLTK